MYQQREQLLEKYELTVKEVSKGRGTVIADTDQGRVILQEYHGSGERVGALAQALAYLRDWDGRTEQLLADREGNYLVTDEEGHRYLLKTGVFGRECDTGNAGEVLAAVKKLASFTLRSWSTGGPEWRFFRTRSTSLPMRCDGTTGNCGACGITFPERRRKMPLRSCSGGAFRSISPRPRRWLRSTLPGEQEEGVCCLCHGDYNQHNVIECRNSPVSSIWRQMRWDEPVSDLTKFLRKVLEKNSWRQDLGLSMIRAYDGIRPLKEKERRKLLLRLSYPARFWNIANHYYNSRKAWVSQRDIEKLKRLLEVENQRKEFLKILYKSN